MSSLCSITSTFYEAILFDGVLWKKIKFIIFSLDIENSYSMLISWCFIPITKLCALAKLLF